MAEASEDHWLKLVGLLKNSKEIVIRKFGNILS